MSASIITTPPSQAQVSSAGRTVQSVAVESVPVSVSKPVAYVSYRDGAGVESTKSMVDEWIWPFFVNDQHWLTSLCSASKVEFFALGFLFNEGIIQKRADVTLLDVRTSPETVIKVALRNRSLALPQRRTLTSGCVGGVTFVDMAAKREPVQSDFRIAAEQITAMMSEMKHSVATVYRSVGGFHTAALSDGDRLLNLVTDIGRHNTLDKIAGECLALGVPTRDHLMLTTGRISSEMLAKAARMQIPVVASLNSPSHLAVQLARVWRITLVGYVRGGSMQVYSAPQRIMSS